MCFLFKKVFPFQEDLSFSPKLVRDHTKIQGNTGGSFFFTRIGSRPYQNSGKYRRVFLFHQNWFATIPKFREIQEGLSFSPELVRDHTKIQGNTGGSFIFHQNWFATIPKFREIQECFLFTMSCLFRSDVSFSIDLSFSKRCFLFKRIFLHQNWFVTIPKFREIQEGLSFHQNWFATIPKFREIQEGLFRSDVSFFFFKSFK